jgi:hypothetical protein
MNANRSTLRPWAASLTLVLAALSACVPAPQLAPRETPPPRSAPPPPPLPPAPRDWRDAPATPGGWSWSREGNGSVARFGEGLFAIRCVGAGGPIRVERAGAARGPLPMTITTTSLARPLTAQPVGNMVAASLSARDPLLDAMAFSRGRIAVEVAGTAPLYIPAWPEMARVIEECR